MLGLSTSKASKGRFLGINAKSLNAKSENGKQGGAIFTRKLRYELQRTAQSILFDPNAEKTHRVCSCHRNVASDGVVVYRNIDGSDARLANLMTCGSVWSCPVCNPKITEARRADMQKAVNGWILDNGSCLLNTLTFPHEADMPLDELLEKFSKALELYKNSRTYKRIFGTSVASIVQREKQGKPLKTIKQGEFPRLGSVRSMEVTHGVNGFHPHIHEVHFMESDKLLEAQAVKDELTQLWVKCLLDSGLGDQSKVNDMLARSWDLRGGDYVSDYINKFGREPIAVNGWTVAHEVTKANSKLGKAGRLLGNDWHYTPFQLLGFATDGDMEAAALFKEFSKCFEGKRMNYWSNGLKDWFKINEVEDEDLAKDEPEQPTEEIVIRLDTQQWRDILATNTRGELLDAAIGGLDKVMQFLTSLINRPKTHKGWFKDQARPDMSRFYN